MEDVLDIDCSDDDFTDQPKTRRARVLEEGIYLKQLNEGTVFSFKENPGDESNEESEVAYFRDEQLLRFTRPDCLGMQDDAPEEHSAPGTTPFEQLAIKFRDMRDDGKLKKLVKKEGVGPVVPPGSMVTVHYNGYREFDDEPFDSTHLRKIPHRIRLGQGMVIEGLDEGVSTMKKGEVAEFLIHPDLAFGARGCPPRIPEGASLLFEVTLENFVDSAVADALSNSLDLDEGGSSFENLMTKARACHKAGQDLFNQQSTSSAIAQFRQAVKMLEGVQSLENEQQSEEQQRLLCRLYINLAICHNRNGESERACKNCRLALEIDQNNAKAHLHYGRALRCLSNFKEAKYHLLKARKQHPDDRVVNAELVKLEEKIQLYKSRETDIAFKMMKDCRITTPAEQQEINMSQEQRQHQAELRTKLDEFEASSGRRREFHPGMSVEDEQFLRGEAKRRGLLVSKTRGAEAGSDSHLTISKPAMSGAK